MNNATSTRDAGLTPFFIDRGAHPRSPLSPPRDDRAAGESPAHYAQRMQRMEAMVRELLAAAQAERREGDGGRQCERVSVCVRGGGAEGRTMMSSKLMSLDGRRTRAGPFCASPQKEHICSPRPTCK